MTTPTVIGTPQFSNSDGQTTPSFSVTVPATGVNRALVVQISQWSSVSRTITGVTYNGVAMTQIDTTSAGSGGDWVRSTAFILLNPDTGSNELEVTASGTSETFRIMASAWQDVAQVTPTVIGKESAVALVSSPHGGGNLTTAVGDVVMSGGDYYKNASFTIAPALAGATTLDELENGSGGDSHLFYYGTAVGTSTTGDVTSDADLNQIAVLSFVLAQAAPSGQDQEGARFYSDDGSESAMTAAAAQDANFTSATAVNKIVRFLINATGDPASTAYTLRAQKNGSGGYTAVPVGASVAEAYGTVTFGAVGTGANGSTTVAPSYPTGITAGQYLLAVVTSGATGSTTPTDSGSKWGSPLATGASTDGTYGVDAGPRRVTVFGCIADGTETGTYTFNISSGGTCRGTIYRFTKAGSGSWDIEAQGGNDSTSGTGFSATLSSMNWNTGDAVLVGVGQRVDTVTQSSQSLSASGVTFGTRTNRASTAVTTGNDHRHVVDTFAAVSSTSNVNAAPTWAYTGSAACSGGVVIVRLREYTAPVSNEVYVSTSSNITAGGEATTARLTAPSGKSTSDFVTGRIWDNENGTDSINITTDDYTEVAWSVQLSASLSNGDYFDFRVYAGASPLDTYTVTPRWTVGPSPITGTDALVITDTGALTGTGALVGLAALVIAAVGLLTGNGALVGSDSITIGSTGTLTSINAISGTNALTISDSGALTGNGALVGADAITLTDAGALIGNGALTGTDSLTLTDTAALTGTGALAGTCAVVFAASGVLSEYVPSPYPVFVNGGFYSDSGSDSSINATAFESFEGGTIFVLVSKYSGDEIQGVSDTAGNDYELLSVGAGDAEHDMALYVAYDSIAEASNIVTVDYGTGAAFRVVVAAQYTNGPTSAQYIGPSDFLLSPSGTEHESGEITVSSATSWLLGGYISWAGIGISLSSLDGSTPRIPDITEALYKIADLETTGTGDKVIGLQSAGSASYAILAVAYSMEVIAAAAGANDLALTVAGTLINASPFVDFSNDTITGSPGEWSRQQPLNPWSVQASTHGVTVTNRHLEYYGTGVGGRWQLIYWDTVANVSGEIETLALVRMAGTGWQQYYEGVGSFARLNTFTGYGARANEGSDDNINYGTQNNSGAGANKLASGNVLGIAYDTAPWVWIRQRLSGSSIQSWMWRASAAPKYNTDTPDLTATDASSTFAGRVGVFSDQNDGANRHLEVGYFSVGFNGVPAPMPINPGSFSGTASLLITDTGTLTGSGALSGTDSLTITDTGALTGTGALIGSDALVITDTGALTGTGNALITGTDALTITCSGTISGTNLYGTDALTLTASGVLRGLLVTTVAIGDNTGDTVGIVDALLSSSSPTTNFGATSDLNVDASAWRAVIRADTLTSVVPIGSMVIAAEWRVAYKMSFGVSRTADMYPLLVSFVEGQTTWNISSTGNNWNTAGAFGSGTDYDPTITGSVVTPTSGTPYLTFTNAALLTLTQNQVAQTVPNYGFVFAASGFVQFSSSEDTDGVRPKFVISYVAPSALTGTDALVFTNSGTLTDNVSGAITGTDALTITDTGTLTGTGALIGAASLLFTDSGVLSGTGELIGVDALTFTDTGILTGTGSMAGSAAIVFTESGTLSNSASGSISGTASLTFTDTGTLTGSGELTGTASILFTDTGALTGTGSMVGSAALVFTDTGTLIGSGALTGTASLTFTDTGTLTDDVSGAMTGSASLVFTESGSLTGTGSMAGLAALVFDDVGTLTNGSSADLIGSASILFTESGSLTGTGSMLGDASIVFTDIGELTGTGSMVGSAALVFDDAGALTNYNAGDFTGSASITFTDTGALTSAPFLIDGGTEVVLGAYGATTIYGDGSTHLFTISIASSVYSNGTGLLFTI